MIDDDREYDLVPISTLKNCETYDGHEAVVWKGSERSWQSIGFSSLLYNE